MHALDVLSRGVVVQAIKSKRGLVWARVGEQLCVGRFNRETSQLEISRPLQKNVATSRARSTECVKEDPKPHCRRKAKLTRTCTVDLGALSVQQLSQIKKQLDEETQSLTNSYAQLRAAQQKFRDCIASIVAGVANSVADKPLLVPLTSSLYVPGTLASTETVLVDVGTGFYVEKTTEQAKKFYETKVEELGKNVKDLETIVQGKNQNLRLIEEGMHNVRSLQ
jgi:prefoldin alpha subunit